MNRPLAFLLVPVLIVIGALAERAINPQNGVPRVIAVQSTPSPVRVAAAPVTADTVAPASNVTVASIDRATEGAYTTASRSVVYVVSAGLGTGSGVVFDSQGDIVTNNHVISGASSVSVTLNDGRSFPAKVIGTDKADDLAVIRIHASGLTPARFATAGNYHVAQMVLAIGSPLGLKQSVSSGLISGIGRVEQEPSGAYLPNAIQTSAPINPGNSGGALVTLNGVVVGIPTLVQTSTSDGTPAQNVGFAIPSDRVLTIAGQIIRQGRVLHTGRAYLGIAPSDPSAQQGWQYGFGQGGPTTVGAVVSQVASGGPADKAGIQQGDVITQADGRPVTDAQDLLSILAGKKPGQSITLKIDRNGQTQTVTANLGELPA